MRALSTVAAVLLSLYPAIIAGAILAYAAHRISKALKLVESKGVFLAFAIGLLPYLITVPRSHYLSEYGMLRLSGQSPTAAHTAALEFGLLTALAAAVAALVAAAVASASKTPNRAAILAAVTLIIIVIGLEAIWLDRLLSSIQRSRP